MSNSRNLTSRSVGFALVIVFAVGVFAPGVATAQDGAISGTVTDTTGGVLPGVTVEAQDAAGTAQVAVTDGTGQFTFSGLVPGTYDVTFTLFGFTVPAQVVEVSAGATATLDVEMALGGLVAQVVVVGTRAEPRSVTASAVPVDVITAQDFVSQGDVDLTNQLRTVVPSFNVNTQPISDAATVVRPANLRNMAPDHTLVLVNGKRRHRAAVIAWLGNGVADGAQGPDLSVIPSIALRQAEVLRDGAAAQYGSDAIAGVMNFELKNARSGGSLEIRSGRRYDENDGDPSSCGPLGRSCNGIGGYGVGYTVAGNVGLPLGSEGFLNLSLEYGGANPTNRAVQDNGSQEVSAGGNSHVRSTSRVWGVPKVEDELKLFGNFGTGGERAEFYGHTNYATKKVTGGFYFRNPNNRGSVYSADGGDDAAGRRRAGRPGPGIRELPDGHHYQWHAGPGGLRRGYQQSELLHVPPAIPRRAGRVSGRLHAAVRRRRPGRVAGCRRARDHGGRSPLGRQRQHRPEPGGHLHLRHGQRVARARQSDQLQAEPAAADRNERQCGPLLRRQRQDQHRRRHRVAERAVHARGWR